MNTTIKESFCVFSSFLIAFIWSFGCVCAGPPFPTTVFREGLIVIISVPLLIAYVLAPLLEIFIILKYSRTTVLDLKVKRVLISKAKKAIRENKDSMKYLKHLPDEDLFRVTFQMAKSCYDLSKSHENRQEQFQEIIRLGEGVLSGTVQYEEYHKQANTLVDQIFEESQPHTRTFYLRFSSYTDEELQAATLFSGISLQDYKESCEKSKQTYERFEKVHNQDKYLQFMSDSLKDWATSPAEYSFSDWRSYVKWLLSLKRNPKIVTVYVEIEEIPEYRFVKINPYGSDQFAVFCRSSAGSPWDLRKVLDKPFGETYSVNQVERKVKSVIPVKTDKGWFWSVKLERMKK